MGSMAATVVREIANNNAVKAPCAGQRDINALELRTETAMTSDIAVKYLESNGLRSKGRPYARPTVFKSTQAPTPTVNQLSKETRRRKTAKKLATNQGIQRKTVQPKSGGKGHADRLTNEGQNRAHVRAYAAP